MQSQPNCCASPRPPTRRGRQDSARPYAPTCCCRPEAEFAVHSFACLQASANAAPSLHDQLYPMPHVPPASVLDVKEALVAHQALLLDFERMEPTIHDALPPTPTATTYSFSGSPLPSAVPILQNVLTRSAASDAVTRSFTTYLYQYLVAALPFGVEQEPASESTIAASEERPGFVQSVRA